MDPETPTPENTQNQIKDSVSLDQNSPQPTNPASIDPVSVVEAPPMASNPAEVVPSQDSAPLDQDQTISMGDSGSGLGFDSLSARRLVIAVVVLLVLTVLWYFSNQQMQKLGNVTPDQDEVTITVSDKQEEGIVTIVEQSSQAINSSTNSVASVSAVIIKAYYLNAKSNPNIANCSKVEMLEKQTERKYSSQIINTMRGLLEPLTSEQQASGWSSAIPAGVLLKSVMIRDGGVAEANFTGNLGRVAGSCAVTAVRAQIEQTLKQFPGVKSVRICIDGNCSQSQILQP